MTIAEKYTADFVPDQEGIWQGLPAKQYHAAPGTSQTIIKRFGEEPTPAHFLESLTRERVPTPEMEFGTILHTAVFEPHNLGTAFYVIPDEYPSADRSKNTVMKPWHGGADYCKVWAREHSDRSCITREQHESIPKIVASVMRQERFAAMVNASQREVSFFKRDPVTGLLLKCRCDAVAVDVEQKTFIGDLKTTFRGGASVDEFRKSVETRGYDLQDASYRYVTGASRFIFCVVEIEPPYEAQEHELDERYVNGGFARYRALLDRYAECVTKNEWPGYGGAKVLSPSRWYQHDRAKDRTV